MSKVALGTSFNFINLFMDIIESTLVKKVEAYNVTHLTRDYVIENKSAQSNQVID